MAGWVRDPDSGDPAPVRVSLDGNVVFDGVADQPRGDGLRGFDVSIPAPPGTHQVCVLAVNVGLGSDRDLGCYTADAVEAPWFDRLGRYLGLLDSTERWEDAPPPLAEPLTDLVELLVPDP